MFLRHTWNLRDVQRIKNIQRNVKQRRINISVNLNEQLLYKIIIVMPCVARLNIELKYMIVTEKWRMRLMELVS